MAKIVGTGAHLTQEQLRVWTSLNDAIRIVDSEIEADLLANHDMTHREYEVLVRVDGAGGRARMSVLALQIEASAPLITQTVQKLEDRGWIARQPSPEDKRGVDAVLTPDGRSALATAAKPHAEAIRSLLLDPLGVDLGQIAAAVGPMADHLRAHRRGETCEDDDCWFQSD